MNRQPCWRWFHESAQVGVRASLDEPGKVKRETVGGRMNAVAARAHDLGQIVIPPISLASDV